MRKRSKKRIPQDVMPGVRVYHYDDDKINIFVKKSSRWASGQSRDLLTKILSHGISLEDMAVINKTLLHDQSAMIEYNLSSQGSNFYSALTRPKNFCLFLGKGRTFNRRYFISRQAMRKLAKTGMLSGLQK